MIQRARAASPSFGEARRDGSAEARTRPTEGLADEPQLASLMLALGRSEALKSDFVATMSHELRSPLNIIMGYVDLVLDGEFGSVTSEQNKVLGYVAKSAVELLDLINAMLTMSRLEKGETALHSETVALAELLTETAAHTFEAQNTHGLGLILDVPPTLGSIHTDPT
ncbi:MAG: histidine kinase dimerization/phospho-acceptor domain-containing protein, partial [bacterium]